MNIKYFGIRATTDAIAAAIAGRAIGALGGNVTANQLIARASGAILNPNFNKTEDIKLCDRFLTL